MMKYLREIIGTTLIAVLFMVQMTAAAPAAADNYSTVAPTNSAVNSVCSEINGDTGCANQTGPTVESALRLVVTLLSILIGFVAVVMIIVNGFRFVTSGGDSSKVAAARRGIVYAVIGLAIAALAQLLVHFVLFQVTHSGPSQPSAATCKQHPKTKGC